MKLKIFSDLQFLPKNVAPVHILQPLLSKDGDGSVHSRFEMTSLDDADYGVLPFDWLHVRGNTWKPQLNLSEMQLANQFFQLVRKANKPLIVFFSDDASYEKIPFEHTFVFRHSLLASRRQEKDFSLSAICEDFIQHYLEGELLIRQKKEKPTIGFMGFADRPSWQIKVKEVLYQAAMLLSRNNTTYFPYRGHFLRTQALDYLTNYSGVNANFVIRDSMAFFEQSTSADSKMQLRLDYVKNLMESDYVLCCRGRGNFSYRIFEALCCGRIPIFIDTDCVLPYDFTIDWRKYCVWIDSKEVSHIGDKVVEFHSALSPHDFVDLQYECRSLWQKWLSQDGFFSNFWLHFEQKR
jgi:hypothetical protein